MQEFVACFCLFLSFDEGCLVCMKCHVDKKFFISFYEFVPAAQFSAFVSICRVISVCGLSLVVYFLSRKMTMRDFDIIASATQHEEYKNSTWHNDPPSFAKSERLYVTLHKREKDDTLETTKFAIENVIALMVGDHFFTSWVLVNTGKQILFVFFLVLPQDVKKEVSILCRDQTRLFPVENSATKLMGYSFTSMLRDDSTYANEMNERGALPLNTLLDNLGNRVNPLSEHADGRIFALPLRMEMTTNNFSSIST